MTSTVKAFLDSIESKKEPKNISLVLRALWFDGIGDWDKAHELIQDDNGKEYAVVHAYLHRKEGDIGNARYWYSRASRSFPSVSLEEEWIQLVEEFI